MTPRVAIVCSGLGHILRGNETWAANVAEGLHKSGGNVIVFGSGARPGARSPYVRVPCLRRDGWMRRFFSWDKAYLWEQVTFARNLKRHLRADRFDIVHAPDPNVAQQLLGHCKRHGLQLIYKDGLFIGPEWCSKFDHVQVLAPFYMETSVDTRGWRVIPHFVDTRAFAPAQNKAAARQKYLSGKISDDALVALAVGDFSPESAKRMDWILSEAQRSQANLQLLFVGNARAADLARLKGLSNGRAHFLTGIDHREMPEVYRASDFFVHAALREPFGIVFIEAMASGLPVLGHHFETTKWIIGDGGEALDMAKEGALAAALDGMAKNQERRARLGESARARARKVFDRDVVLPMYHDWYQKIAASAQRP